MTGLTYGRRIAQSVSAGQVIQRRKKAIDHETLPRTRLLASWNRNINPLHAYSCRIGALRSFVRVPRDYPVNGCRTAHNRVSGLLHAPLELVRLLPEIKQGR